MNDTAVSLAADLPIPFEDALSRVTAALSQEGFGVLTTIDVQSTLRAKLGVDFRRYLILGACNPLLAHCALSSDLGVGLLLPCNVIVYEMENGATRVEFMDPVAALALSGNEALRPVAEEARIRLERTVGSLSALP